MKRPLVLLALLAALFLGWRILGSGPQPTGAAAQTKAPAEVAVPVTLVTVARADMRQTYLLTGTLRTDLDVTLGAKIPGRVATVAVREGDRVRPGQVVAQLETAQLEAQVNKSLAAMSAARARLAQARNGAVVKDSTAEAELQRAAANLDAARARLSQARSQAAIADTEAQAQLDTAESALQWAREKQQTLKEGARQQERRQAEIAVEQAKVTMDEARGRYERRRQLARDGAIADEEVDAAERQFRVAEAQYRAAQAQRDLVEEGTRSTELRMAEEEVRQAEEKVRQARANLARRKISEEEVQAAQSAVRQAEAAHAQAKAGMAQKKLTQDDIRTAAAAVAQAEADVAFDRQQLADARITSPVAGVVVKRSVNPGEAIGAAAPLLRVVSARSVYFEGDVPERELPRLAVGLPVAVTVDALPGRQFRGAVAEIIPVAEEGSRAFRVRVRVPASDKPLPVGGFARGTVTLDEKRGTLVVPREAVRSEAGDAFVYRNRNGRAQRRAVVVGIADAERVEIVSGLSPGDAVVGRGAANVADGDRLSVTRAE
jgi:multidrug efflux pump subunit AcrA (membrane-fusion protein)